MTTIPLPPPASLSMPLEEAIRRRCSNRSISEAPLSDEELSALLWACAGQGRDGEHRTTPSTRGLKSDLAYVLRADGVWLYDEAANALVQSAEDDVRLASTEAQGDWVGRAACTIAIVADHERAQTARASGIYSDAGVMAEALSLAASALGLAGCIRASFDHEKLAQAMKLPPDREPILLYTAGRPA